MAAAINSAINSFLDSTTLGQALQVTGAGQGIKQYNRQKQAQTNAINDQTTAQANQVSALADQQANAQVQDAAVKQRQASLAKQKSKQTIGRDSTVLNSPNTVLGESSGKTLLGQ